MVKLIIAAVLTLLGVVAGGIVADVGASTGVAAVVGIVTTAGAALGGPSAVKALVAMIPRTVYDEIVAYGTAGVLALQGGQLAALALPVWLHVAIGAVITLLGVLGVRAGVTPLSKQPSQAPPATGPLEAGRARLPG